MLLQQIPPKRSRIKTCQSHLNQMVAWLVCDLAQIELIKFAFSLLCFRHWLSWWVITGCAPWVSSYRVQGLPVDDGETRTASLWKAIDAHSLLLTKSRWVLSYFEIFVSLQLTILHIPLILANWEALPLVVGPKALKTTKADEKEKCAFKRNPT